MSSLVLVLITAASSLRAHEVQPAIADMEQTDDGLAFTVTLNLEGILAGIDLSAVTDTNTAPGAAQYDVFRAMPPAELEAVFRAGWPAFASRIAVRAGDANLPLTLDRVTIPPVGDLALPREATLQFTAAITPGVAEVVVGWDAAFGTLVLRQQGVDAPYTGYLEAGTPSAPVALAGGGAMGSAQAFVAYIPVGFDHIVPQGLDHILFVLGLFFLSLHMRPLLWQVSSFTVAHTLTLGLAALGYVNLPGSIVEPLIAASIVFVAVENILAKGFSYWRPLVVFGFGLLHGLGFASVLGEFGLPEGAFVPALLGFNVGVELGQLAVIAGAFALVGYWFGGKEWYTRVIAMPASAAIALVGGWWFIERVFL